MGRSTTLLCTAMPFGYGPASKLIALARPLRRHMRLVFVGRGVALELIRREPDLFHEIVPLAPDDPAADAHVADADGILSLMDREAGTVAAAAGKPLFVVDSLLWMRPEIPPPFRTARRYFAQAFPGLTADAYAPQPEIVGPLLGDAAPAGGPRTGLVVHLGGSAAPDDRRALYQAYARRTLECVVAAGLVERFGSVLVLGGADAQAGLEDAGGDERIRVASVPPTEARTEMARAAAVLTSPGLTATLECFRAGVPTWFLPPQNYSQWLILRTLRSEGVAGSAFHWEDLPGVPTLERGMTPAEHGPIVRAALERLDRGSEAVAPLQRSLAEVGHAAGRIGVTGQAFFATLGPPALGEVVDGLRRALTSPASPEEPRCG